MKLTLHEIIIFLVFAVMIALAIGCVVLWFVAIFKYSTTPITELPAWAYFILMRGGNR